jgi:hypothetical protein
VGNAIGVNRKIKKGLFAAGKVSVRSMFGQGGVAARSNETQKISCFAERKEGE